MKQTRNGNQFDSIREYRRLVEIDSRNNHIAFRPMTINGNHNNDDFRHTIIHIERSDWILNGR